MTEKNNYTYIYNQEEDGDYDDHFHNISGTTYNTSIDNINHEEDDMFKFMFNDDEVEHKKEPIIGKRYMFFTLCMFSLLSLQTIFS